MKRLREIIQEDNIAKIKKLLARHDVTYQRSDDSKAFAKGRRSADQIGILHKQLNAKEQKSVAALMKKAGFASVPSKKPSKRQKTLPTRNPLEYDQSIANLFGKNNKNLDKTKSFIEGDPKADRMVKIAILQTKRDYKKLDTKWQSKLDKEVKKMLGKTVSEL